MGRIILLIFAGIMINSLKAASQLHLKASMDTVTKNFNIRVLPQNFYNKHIGFFCKKEVQIQKLVSMPVYFRLGSKDYVDWMERKPNAKRF
ncbi:MAG: hypothetical protein ACXWCZ_05035 [Flavisolibacter sp.]